MKHQKNLRIGVTLYPSITSRLSQKRFAPNGIEKEAMKLWSWLGCCPWPSIAVLTAIRTYKVIQTSQGQRADGGRVEECHSRTIKEDRHRRLVMSLIGNSTIVTISVLYWSDCLYTRRMNQSGSMTCHSYQHGTSRAHKMTLSDTNTRYLRKLPLRLIAQLYIAVHKTAQPTLIHHL